MTFGGNGFIIQVMLQSRLFPKTKKEAPASEVSVNARLLIRAGYIDKLMAGVHIFLPLGFRVLRKIESIIREEMEAAGGQELLMSALQPKENWQRTGRWETYDSLFRFVSFYTKTELALGPTHEEIISPLVAKTNLSYKDLPLYLFQIQTKFRDEKRAKSGILRGREFIMKDFYSFHRDEADMENFYEKMKTHYMNIFKACGIGDKTYITFASGGTFSRYSHEFQTVTPFGEDTIYICGKCRVAINKEIIEEQDSCPQCGNKELKEEKAIEVGNIFPLKTKYSEPFGLKYTDEDGGKKDVIMGCYGIGLDRLMGTIVEVNHDEEGIIWPERVAPFQAHLLLLGRDEKVRKYADEIYTLLQEAGIDVLYDERSDSSMGEKLKDADLLGIPWRLVASEKTFGENKIEVKRRDSDEVKLAAKDDLIKLIKG